jgi:hypothetical protein
MCFPIYNQPAPFISPLLSHNEQHLSAIRHRQRGEAAGMAPFVGRVATPSSDGSPPTDSEEDWEADKEEEEEAEEAAAARSRAKAEAEAMAQPASTIDDEGDTNSSDASNDTCSSEEVTSRKRHHEDDEAGPSK